MYSNIKREAVIFLIFANCTPISPIETDDVKHFEHFSCLRWTFPCYHFLKNDTYLTSSDTFE